MIEAQKSMTLEEVRAIMKQHGNWTYVPKTRKGNPYVYVARKVAGAKQERYIGSLTSVLAMSEDDLSSKLDSFESEKLN